MSDMDETISECEEQCDTRKRPRRVYYADVATMSDAAQRKFFKFMHARFDQEKDNKNIHEIVNVWNKYAKSVDEHAFVRCKEVDE